MDNAEKNLMVMEARKKEILRAILLFWLTSTVFIFLRIFLEAIGSDPKSAFVSIIYLVSDFFMVQFFGIFRNVESTIQPGVSTFDGAALTAIFCNSVLSLLAVAVIMILTKMFKTSKQMDETVKRDHIVDPTVSESIVK